MTTKKNARVVAFVLFSFGLFGLHSLCARPAAPRVPETLVYCGHTLQFTPAGRAAIQQHVNKLHANTLYFRILVEKANLYMPFVEHALELMNVPEDLKYICLQESALQGDAVSSSNAVGFWQFKHFTAEEVGLVINEGVDERKHIFRSSVGAARYFSKNFIRHPNWVYSIISYYAGGTGAIPFINTDYYGATHMTVDEQLHWYAQKAIAHKIAFEPYLIGGGTGKLWLQPVASGGETSIWKIAKEQGVGVEQLRTYNLWMSSSPLPTGYEGTVYVPRADQPYAFHADPYASRVTPLLPDQPGVLGQYAQLALNKLEPKPQPQRQPDALLPPTAEQAEKSPEVQHARTLVAKYRDLPQPYSHERREYVAKEPMMGRAFALVTPNFGLKEIAGQFQVEEDKLRALNGLGYYEQAQPGTLIWLIKPRRSPVYIVQKETTLAEVSAVVRRPVSRLAVYNQLSIDARLQPGQKLYTQAPRPANEPPIRYLFTDDRIDLTGEGRAPAGLPTGH
ncbi:MAG: transglycosylase SLT domain-containing protein [Sphingobacteriia bacterium]